MAKALFFKFLCFALARLGFCLYLCSLKLEIVMAIPVIESVKAIEQQFYTGEEPVLVTCSDRNTYICKYMRSPAAAYKLVCELIGAQMAMSWQLNTPEVAFVRIKPSHWSGIRTSHTILAPALGSRRIDGVMDITPSTYRAVNTAESTLLQLMKIALFDFWIANEDRNANNANLLYDLVHERLVSIDYGCILNTASFDFPLSQLTSTDTILWSDLFRFLAKGKKRMVFGAFIEVLKRAFQTWLNRSEKQVGYILNTLPIEWNVPTAIVENKLLQLFDEQWISATWKNFVECINENISNE